jgi:hypothetical protein
MTALAESAKWRCKTTVRKFDGDVSEYIARFGEQEGLRRFYAEHTPVEEIVREGNILTQTGIEAIWKLVAGLTATAYSNANARLGVGNDNTAAQATDTDLIGASKAWKGMEVGYPVVSALADKKITFRSIFGSSEGNFAWLEWGVDNGASAHKLLNRKVENLGTKSSGSWQLTIEISLS